MNPLSQSIGSYISHIEEPDGLYIHAENADVRIRIWSQNIIQIHISIDEEADSFSYAVTGNPEPVNFKISESFSLLEVKTPALSLKISKKRVRFAFYNRKGQLINEDDPAFGTSWIGNEMTTYKSLQEGERFIGLGEKSKNLDKRGEAFVNWNTDAFAYNASTDPMYVSTPFYIGIHHKIPYGIFLDNSYKSTFNFGASNHRFASFSVESGDMNYFFIHHDNIADIVRSYSILTGAMPLPPKWSLGYQQCRYSYYPDLEVMEIGRTFREKEIPCDVIYLDIHYMEDYKLFTWDKNRFPDPKGMISKLNRDGFKVVVIIDPGVKIEEGYDVYKSGLQNEVFVKYPDGTNYSASVWPGECHFPDFTHPKVRSWWADQMKELSDVGLTGFWNDMNEPASWGQSTPDLIEFNYEGHTTTHKKARNVYGFLMAKATYEGTRLYKKKQRPFVLSRAGYSGVQRYAAIWTGDNTASDESMMLGVRLVYNLGLAGIPFSGFDVGGFLGESSMQLYQRWIAIGAFTPFFRGHTMINSKRSEPWSYGEETEEISRNYISLRYRLLPYLYSLFYKASIDGSPINTPMVYEHIDDDRVFDNQYQNQFYHGPSFLVCPVESDKVLKKIYLPKGVWYDLYNDKKYTGSNEYVIEAPYHRLPVFVRSSSIVVMQSIVQSTSEKTDETLVVHIYNGRSKNNFIYYEDDGESYLYENGEYFRRTIDFDPTAKKIELSDVKGKWVSNFKTIRTYFHGFRSMRSVTVNGKKVKCKYEKYRFVKPISNFDPYYRGEDMTLHIDELPFIEFKNLKKAIELRY